MENVLKDYIQPLVIIFGAVFALHQYWKQQQFKRLQNLSALWKNFSTEDDLLQLFSTMDEIENGNKQLVQQLEITDRKIKLKYLALIEEAALYVEKFEVDKAYAKYLFQWHFHYAFSSNSTSTAFWSNIGGEPERTASYWSKSRTFAQQNPPA